MELQICIYGLIVSTILYTLEMKEITKFSKFIFSYSKCDKRELVRKVFLTSFLLCGLYRTLAAYLKTKGYNRTNKRYKLDFLGDGQKPILFCFGTWQITHILLYMWYGYICPRDWLFALTIGTIFEIIEYILGNLESSVGIKTEKYWTTGNNSLNTKDIIANSVGFIIGSSISLLSKI